MRAVVIFLALAMVVSVVPGAQCVLRCAQPPSTPPCHHAPSNQSPSPQKTCELVMMAGESPVLRVATRGAACQWISDIAAVAEPVPPVAMLSKLPSFHASPPRSAWAADNPVLRI